MATDHDAVTLLDSPPTPPESPVSSVNVATLQNNPGAEPARADIAPEPLTADEVNERITKWAMYDTLFDRLKRDVLILYDQFSAAEPNINPWVWPADSYAKTQIYKAAHFLAIYYEARLREVRDLLMVVLQTLENERAGNERALDVQSEALD